MDALSKDALVLAILFTWLDGEKQEEILKLLDIKVKEAKSEKHS